MTLFLTIAFLAIIAVGTVPVSGLFGIRAGTPHL